MRIIGGSEQSSDLGGTSCGFLSPKENHGGYYNQPLFKCRFLHRPVFNRMRVFGEHFKNLLDAGDGQNRNFHYPSYFPSCRPELVKRAGMGDHEVWRFTVSGKPGRKLFFKELGQRIVVIAGKLLTPKTIQQ